MNAYVVKTKDERSYVEPILEDGTGPSYTCWPIAPVVAETAGQAKSLFLREFTQEDHSGVETDDWPNLRVRLLVKDVSLPAGVIGENDRLWLRIHEVEDHDGRPCDCPEEFPL